MTGLIILAGIASGTLSGITVLVWLLTRSAKTSGVSEAKHKAAMERIDVLLESGNQSNESEAIRRGVADAYAGGVRKPTSYDVP